MRGGQIPRPTLAARGRIDEPFDVSIVRGRSRRSSDDGVEDGVAVVGEVVAAWVDVYGGLEGFDEAGLFEASPDPIGFGRQRLHLLRENDDHFHAHAAASQI